MYGNYPVQVIMKHFLLFFYYLFLLKSHNYVKQIIALAGVEKYSWCWFWIPKLTQSRGRLMPTFQQSRQVISEMPVPDFIPCAFETIVCISFSLDTSSHCRKLLAKIFFWEQGEEVWATAFDFSSEDQFCAVCFLYAVTIFLFCHSLWNPFKSIMMFES